MFNAASQDSGQMIVNINANNQHDDRAPHERHAQEDYPFILQPGEGEGENLIKGGDHEEQAGSRSPIRITIKELVKADTNSEISSPMQIGVRSPGSRPMQRQETGQGMFGEAIEEEDDENVPDGNPLIFKDGHLYLNESKKKNKQKLKKIDTVAVPYQGVKSKKAEYHVHGTNGKTQAKDAFVLIQNFSQVENQYLYGVFEGQGIAGAKIAHSIKRTFPATFNNIAETNKKFIEGKDKDKINKVFSEVNSDMKNQIFKKSFTMIHSQIRITESFKPSESGSTALLSTLSQNTLSIAQAGPSRAYIITETNTGSFTPIQISPDHLPLNEKESTRIDTWGHAEIRPARDDNGDFNGETKIWAENQCQPGVETTRCLGLIEGQRLGIIYEPEVNDYTLTAADRAIVIVTSGVWKRVTDMEIANLVHSVHEPSPHPHFYFGFKKEHPKLIAQALVKSARERTPPKEKALDATCIVILLKHRFSHNNK